MPKTKAGKVFVPRTDVTDWYEMALELGICPQTEQEAYELMAISGMLARVVGRAIVAQRETGEVPKHLISEVKSLISQAATMEMIRLKGRLGKVEKTLSSGREADVYEVVGNTHPADDDPSYMPVDTKAALERIQRQLFGFVLGTIQNRLMELDITQGPQAVRDTIARFKSALDEIEHLICG